jgi:hypothetical protein
VDATDAIGAKLGCGLFRCAYEYGTDKVIKINTPVFNNFSVDWRTGMRQGNQREWHVWQKIQGTALEPYFARAIELTPSGDLIMERAECTFKFLECECQVHERERERLRMLSYALDCYDAYEDNVGLVNGQMKILDYQLVDLRRLSSGIRLVKEWQNV